MAANWYVYASRDAISEKLGFSKEVTNFLMDASGITEFLEKASPEAMNTIPPEHVAEIAAHVWEQAKEHIEIIQ